MEIGPVAPLLGQGPTFAGLLAGSTHLAAVCPAGCLSAVGADGPCRESDSESLGLWYAYRRGLQQQNADALDPGRG